MAEEKGEKTQQSSSEGPDAEKPSDRPAGGDVELNVGEGVTARLTEDRLELHLNGEASRALISRAEADEQWEKAKRCYADQDYEGAREAYELLVRDSPDYPDAWFYKGNAEARLGRFEAANESYTEDIARAPSAMSHFNRYGVRKKLGDLSGARTDIDTAIELDAAATPAFLVARAKLLWDLDDVESAISGCDHALGLAPADVDALELRGRLLFQHRRFDEAIRDATELLTLTINVKTKIMAHRLRGMGNMSQGRPEAALADLDALVELAASDAANWSNRGFCYAEIGRFEQALSDLDKAISLRNDYQQAYFNRASVHERLAQPAKARADYERLRELGCDVEKQLEALGKG